MAHFDVDISEPFVFIGFAILFSLLEFRYAVLASLPLLAATIIVYLLPISDGQSISFAPARLVAVAIMWIASALAGYFAEWTQMDCRTSADAVVSELKVSEAMVGAILPPVALDQLKQGHSFSTAAPEAGVLFTDLVGFTSMCGDAQPSDIISLLNIMYVEFDRLAKLHGCQTIETIGDAYVACSGLMVIETDHIQRLVDLAIALQRSMVELRDQVGLDIHMRVGVHLGPVLAGVLKNVLPKFEIFGATVGLAEQVQTACASDRVAISNHVAKKLLERDSSKYTLTPVHDLHDVPPQIGTMFHVDKSSEDLPQLPHADILPGAISGPIAEESKDGSSRDGSGHVAGLGNLLAAARLPSTAMASSHDLTLAIQGSSGHLHPPTSIELSDFQRRSASQSQSSHESTDGESDGASDRSVPERMHPMQKGSTSLVDLGRPNVWADLERPITGDDSPGKRIGIKAWWYLTQPSLKLPPSEQRTARILAIVLPLCWMTCAAFVSVMLWASMSWMAPLLTVPLCALFMVLTQVIVKTRFYYLWIWVAIIWQAMHVGISFYHMEMEEGRIAYEINFLFFVLGTLSTGVFSYLVYVVLYTMMAGVSLGICTLIPGSMVTAETMTATSWSVLATPIVFMVISIISTGVRRSDSKQLQIGLKSMAKERARNLDLLARLLPASILHRTLVEQQLVADLYPTATVMFVSIHEFGALMSKVSARRLLHLLTSVFAEIDEQCIAHGARIVDVIRETFLVSCGVPEDVDDPTERLAQVALGLQQAMPEMARKLKLAGLGVVIGINSGNVIGGVIGPTLAKFSVFGDVVNIASRMASTAEKGTIQLSQETAKELPQDMLVRKRSGIYVKGQGIVDVMVLN